MESETSTHRNASLVIATPEFDKLSETFITRHRDELPFPIQTLSGRPIRFAGPDKLDLTHTGRWERIRRRIESRLGRTADEKDRRHAAIASWLKNVANASAVLGEYGMYARELVTPCQMAQVPLIVHFHGFDAFNRVQIGKVLEDYRRMFEYASALIAVSGPMKDRLVELGAPEDKIHLIPYAFNPSFEKLSAPATSNAAYLAVGRFVEKKAPFLTILAFQKVTAQIPDAHLTFIGDGPLRDPCETMVSALGLSDNVTFRGALAHAEVAEAMKSARCFVQHSVEASNGDCEGTPLAILEAQAAGLPVVSTFHSGIKEAVANEETGFLVEEKDVQGMADGLVKLGQDAELAAKLGRQGSVRVRELYSLDRTLGRLASLISAVSGLKTKTKTKTKTGATS